MSEYKSPLMREACIFGWAEFDNPDADADDTRNDEPIDEEGDE